jgi:hypothetical protein
MYRSPVIADLLPDAGFTVYDDHFPAIAWKIVGLLAVLPEAKPRSVTRQSVA